MDYLSPPSPSSPTVLFLSLPVLFLSHFQSYFSLPQFSCISSWKFQPEILTFFTLTLYLDLRRNPESLSNLLSLSFCKVNSFSFSKVTSFSFFQQSYFSLSFSKVTSFSLSFNKVTFILIFCSSIPRKHIQALRGATTRDNKTSHLQSQSVEKQGGNLRRKRWRERERRKIVNPVKQASNGQYNPVYLQQQVSSSH